MQPQECLAPKEPIPPLTGSRPELGVRPAVGRGARSIRQLPLYLASIRQRDDHGWAALHLHLLRISFAIPAGCRVTVVRAFGGPAQDRSRNRQSSGQPRRGTFRERFPVANVPAHHALIAVGLDPLSWTHHERRIRWSTCRSRRGQAGHGERSRTSSRRKRFGWFSARGRRSARSLGPRSDPIGAGGLGGASASESRTEAPRDAHHGGARGADAAAQGGPRAAERA